MALFTKTQDSMEALALAIASRAYDCAEQVITKLEFDSENARHLMWYRVYSEFMYGFIRVTDRLAFASLGAEKKTQVLAPLGPIVAKVHVEAHLGHWPDDNKSKIEMEFMENLNDAQEAFSSCKAIWVDDPPLSRDSVIDTVGFNVAETIRSDNVFDILFAKGLVVEALVKTNFRTLIENAAAETGTISQKQRRVFGKLLGKLDAIGKKRLDDDLKMSLFLIQVAILRIASADQAKRPSKDSTTVAIEAANLLVQGESLHQTSLLGGDEDDEANYGPSPDDLRIQRRGKALAKKLAEQSDLVRNASVLALRTTLFMHPERATELVEMTDWIGSLGGVPAHRPDPDIMRKLAHEMASTYCPDMLQSK